MKALLIPFVALCLTCSRTLLFAQDGAGLAPAGGDGAQATPQPMRSLGLYVTLSRLSQMTPTGLKAIPQGALVSVVENDSGQKFAVFRQVSVAISNLAQLSNDPVVVARVTSSTPGAGAPKSVVSNPGAVITDKSGIGPQSRTQEQIKLDDSGKVISRMKTTVINDGAGSTTTITQGRTSGMTPEQAGRLAAAKQKIAQQREAISELKSRRSQKAIMSGYASKLQEMTDLLSRMETEYARMEAEFHQ